MPAERPIILTGAASGIGRAAAEQLAAKSRVLALVDVHADGLHQVVATCQRHSPRTRGFGCDVAEPPASLSTAPGSAASHHSSKSNRQSGSACSA
jgi:NAD(P)-dependent dehydrogenase (short-subunit alcohol dehydrogenase family)